MQKTHKILIGMGAFAVIAYLFNKKSVIANSKELIKKWEGLLLTAKKDIVGIPTIGYGNISYELVPSIAKRFGRKKVQMGDKITKAEAEALLEANIDLIATKITQALKRPNPKPNELAALISFAYNVGINGLLRSTLFKLYNVNTPVLETAKQFDKYVYAGGQRSKGLANRRADEKKIFTA
jgi:lysozyme